MASEAAQPEPRLVRSGTVRRMVARRRDELHRVATPLELFFDLCFVVAVAQAGGRLALALADGNVVGGLADYCMVFFAIWWAWMNFSWFASAYDTDDVLYRITTLVQIAGALILAAGVPRLFNHQDLALTVLGYVVMRLAMVSQWVRAAREASGAVRTMCLRYAGGIMVLQGCWVLLNFAPHSVRIYLIPVAVLGELAVPLLAERAAQSAWHPHHISERYGLFTLIVLGETVSAATVAIQSALDEHSALGELVSIAAGGMLICFGAWWIYFAKPIHGQLRSSRQAFLWGYGHYFVLGSAAAIGAGLQVAVEYVAGKAHIPVTAATAAVTVPTAVYLLATWAVHSRLVKRGAAQTVLPIGSLAVLACTAIGRSGVLAAGLVVAAGVAVGLWLQSRES